MRGIFFFAFFTFFLGQIKHLKEMTANSNLQWIRVRPHPHLLNLFIFSRISRFGYPVQYHWQYQLNQFVGHRSQASSIWRKVTAVTGWAVTLKITKNFKKGSKNRNFSYKSPSKFLNIVNWRNHNFIRRVTGHTGWRIDLIGTVPRKQSVSQI